MESENGELGKEGEDLEERRSRADHEKTIEKKEKDASRRKYDRGIEELRKTN